MASKENQYALLDECSSKEVLDYFEDYFLNLANYGWNRKEKMKQYIDTLRHDLADLSSYKKALHRLCCHCALLSQDNTIKFEELKIDKCFPEEYLSETDGKFYMKKYLNVDECKENWLTAEQIEEIVLDEAREEIEND